MYIHETQSQSLDTRPNLYLSKQTIVGTGYNLIFGNPHVQRDPGKKDKTDTAVNVQ